MAYKIKSEQCMGCHSCMGACPVNAIVITPDGKCAIEKSKCISCGTCAAICPVNAIVPE